MLPSRCSLLMLSVLGCSHHLTAQVVVDSTAKTDPIASALRDLVAATETADKPKSLAPIVERLVNALGDQAEGKVPRRVLEILRGAEAWTDLGDTAIAELLELTGKHRLSRRVDLLAPAILVLAKLRPDQPEVQHATAELFGVASAIFDTTKALAALARIEELVPQQDDGLPETLGKLIGLAHLVGDLGDGWRGVSALWDYWKASKSALGNGGTLHMLSPADLRAFELVPDLVPAYRRGRQADVRRILGEWGKLQNDNPAQLLLLAELRASLGDAYDDTQDSSRAHVTKFLFLTEPAMLRSDSAWRFEEVRWVLHQFDIECGDSIETLRQYARSLESQLADRASLPLVRMADFDALKLKTKSLEAKLPGKERELDVKAASLNRRQKEWEDAPGSVPMNPPENYEYRKGIVTANAERNLETAKKAHATSKLAFDEAEEKCALHRARLDSYEKSGK